MALKLKHKKSLRKHQATEEPPPPPASPSPPPLDVVLREEYIIAEEPIVMEDEPCNVGETVIGPTTVSEDTLQQHWTSPYTEAPVSVHIGPDEIKYYVPRHFLPAQWVKSGIQEQFYFPDVDIQTGHTLVHYLHKGTYETPASSNDPPSLRARTKLKAALLVFIATSDHDLAGLQHLAVREIEEHGSSMDIFEIIEVIDNDFSRLGQNSWVHGYLHRIAKVAFEQDHTVFTNEPFLQNLNNAALIKFLARCTIDMYNTRLSCMLNSEKEQCRRLDQQSQRVEDYPELKRDRISVASPTEDLPVEQSCAPAEEIAPSDDFCTISCPGSESPVCEVDVVMHEKTAVDIYETSDYVIEETGYAKREVPIPAEPEPEPPVLVPDSAQLLPCDVPLEPSSEDTVAVPTDYHAPDCDVPPCPKPADIQLPEESVTSGPCHLGAKHIIKGKGWKECKRCRKFVEHLKLGA